MAIKGKMYEQYKSQKKFKDLNKKLQETANKKINEENEETPKIKELHIDGEIFYSDGKKIWADPHTDTPEELRFYHLPEDNKRSEKEKKELIEKHKKIVEEYVIPTANKEGKTLGQIMQSYTKNAKELDDKVLSLEEIGIDKYETGISPQHPNKKLKGAFSAAAKYSTKRDLQWLTNHFPTKMSKFYLSCKPPKTKEEKKRVYHFLEAIITQARKENISMTMKTHIDHTYDSPDIYTYDFEAMKKILQKIYPKYKDIFVNVKRVFQGNIEGISPEHIGYVEEPAGGTTIGTHSARMNHLGKELAKGKPYELACKEAGVKPEAPWEVDHSTNTYRYKNQDKLERIKKELTKK